MGRTNFEAYGIDRATSSKKIVSIFAENVRQAKEYLERTRPSFEVMCIYPVMRINMQYDVSMLRKIVKKLNKDIENASRFKNDKAIKEVNQLVLERRYIAALIDNNGIWEPNMYKPNLAKYSDMFSNCANQIHVVDSFIAGIYHEDEDAWHDAEPIKSFMLTGFIQERAQTTEEIVLASSMLISQKIYEDWWEKQSKEIKQIEG